MIFRRGTSFLSELLIRHLSYEVVFVDHLSLSSTEVKNMWSFTSIPPIRLHGVMLN